MKLGVEVFSGSRGLGLSDAALEPVDEELKRLVGVSGAIIGDESVQRNAFRCLITQAWDRNKCTHELSYVHQAGNPETRKCFLFADWEICQNATEQKKKREPRRSCAGCGELRDDKM